MYSKQKLPPVAGHHGLDVERWSTSRTTGPFVTHLWRATHAIPKSEAAREHRPKTLNFKRRVEHAVGWLWDLLGIASRFKTQCALAARSETPRWSTVADAFLLGMGAIFIHQSWFLRRIERRSSGSGTWRDSAHRRRTLRSNPNGSCWLFSFRSSCSLPW